MRPLAELPYWKATELRLFLLYAGIVLLKEKNILSKEKYSSFLKFSIAMRILLSQSSSDNDMTICHKLLIDFCHESQHLYGKGFLTYNVHSIIHLTDDFIRFGPLDYVSCFKFESYLGILKSYVQGGYKPLQQISFRVFHSNASIVQISKQKNDITPGQFFKIAKKQASLIKFEGIELCYFFKAKLFNESVININSEADSNIFVEGYIARVFQIVKCDEKKCFVVKKFKKTKNFFSRPICSFKVGIFAVNNLSEKFEIVEFTRDISKCALFPFKTKFVAICLCHSV